MQHRKVYLSLAIILIVSVSLFFLYFPRLTAANIVSVLKSTPQNASVFLNPQTENQPLLSTTQQQQLSQNYLKHFFSPWTNVKQFDAPWVGKTVVTILDLKQIELNWAQDFLTAPGWGENRLHNSKQWIQTIIANMDLSSFPNHQHKAITTDNANMRVLPTDDQSYANWSQAGEGYPFDYLQQSYVPANTPALILQTSHDHAWDLVLVHNDLGWIKAQRLADVNQIFIKAWQTGDYAALIHDHVPMIDVERHFIFMGRIGAIYPLALTHSKPSTYTLQIAVADANDQAVIKHVILTHQEATDFPLVITPKNVAVVANHLLNDYYGWGGMNGYRDCSLTMTDLFTPFGIWLPRSSEDQVETGKFTVLTKLSDQQKTQTIIQQGIPFLTLLRLPGHIVLYIGEKNGVPYIFHDFWGVHTRGMFGYRGRVIVGKTAITPITLGQDYLNVPKSFLELVQGMAVLGPRHN